MIHVPRKDPPPIFQSKNWHQEQKKAIEFYSKSLEERRKSQFVFKFYKHPEVREALDQLFYGKCAFCESNYRAVSPMDIENFRPKNGAVGLDGKLSRDHYWWLASEWFNLYAACVECNRAKGPRFPVEGERAKIQATESEIRSEKALLLDPCVDHPEYELTFNTAGMVASNTLRGRTTIETYNLNRTGLAQRRAAFLKNLRSLWNRVVSLLSFKRKQGNKADPILDQEIKLLREYLQPQGEFLALTRQWLQLWSLELTNKFPSLKKEFADLVTLRTGVSHATVPPTPIAKTAKATKSAKTTKTKPSLEASSAPQIKKSISRTIKSFGALEKEKASYSLAKTSDHEKFFSQTRYIESLEIKNFKVIKHIKLEFSQTPDAGSWLLILGENGTGKSSVLQAVAIALMGDLERKRLGVDDGSRLATYPRKKSEVVEGFVKVKLTGGGDPIILKFRSDSPKIVTNAPEPKVLLLGYSATRLLPLKGARLTKGSRFSKTDNLFNPFLALTKSSLWLHKLKEPSPFDYVEQALKRLMMLKPRDHFDKTNDGRIQVKAFGGSTVYLEDLSAGYQSVLALSTDIMSVLLKLWESVSIAEAIVLIDEIDAHLHPRWKMQIVERLRLTFPRVQFLVTSHEPLSLRGLNQQEVVVMTRSARGRVSKVTEELPNPKALRIDQLLTSEYFGLSSTLSPELEIEFNEYYALLALRKRSDKQQQRLDELKKRLDGLRLMGDTPRERMMYEVIDEFLALKAKQRQRAEKLDQRTKNIAQDVAGGLAMIKVKRPRPPRELSTPAAAVKAEREAALRFHKKKASLSKEFPFKVYREDYVKAAIEKAFHKKCAYCESFYIITQPVDVEHFRPKGAVTDNGKQKKPAYYWLASDWANLLPSCIRCNRANKYKMPDKKTVTMGKKNFFPLAVGSPRATKPGDESKEKPLLLNPYRDDPSRHLEFTSEGIVRAVENIKGKPNKKAEESIFVYALSRPDLVERRAGLAKMISAQIERVKEATLNVRKYPADKTFKTVLRRELTVLKSFRNPEKEYSALARQLTDDFIKTV